MSDKLEEFILARFLRKSGKIDKVLEGISSGMLELWALQNTPKTRDCVIFSKTSGEVVMYTEGTDSDPKVYKDSLGNIEMYCPGLLAAMQD